MKARLTLVILFLIPTALLLFYTYSPARNDSSCVTCHTDEAQLKKTCKPFVMPAGEGEG